MAVEMKTLEERYGDEILTDNSGAEPCRQCKDCMFRNDGTDFSNDYHKGCCEMFPYPEVKPLEVIDNTGECEYYEKEE